MVEKRKSRVADAVTTARGIIYIVLAVAGVVFGSTFALANWSDAVSDNSQQIAVARMEREKLTQTVSVLETQLLVMNTTLGDTAEAVQALGADSADASRRLTQLQTEVEGFRDTQQQMLEVLLTLSARLGADH